MANILDPPPHLQNTIQVLVAKGDLSNHPLTLFFALMRQHGKTIT